MTVPQIQIIKPEGVHVQTNMAVVPRVGEYILHGSCYFKVKDIFHRLDGVVYVICDQCYYFIKDYKHELHDNAVENFKKAILVEDALDKGILKVGEPKEKKT